MKLKAFLISLLTLISFFLILEGLNRVAMKPHKSSVTNFQVQKINSVAKTNVVKPKPKKVKKVNDKNLKPKLKMQFAGSGTDLGLDILNLNAGQSSLFGDADEATLTEGLVDEAPTISYREPIPFPDFAKDQNLSGFVTLNLLIQKNGKVEKIKVLESQPQGVFDNYALQSVKNWVFEPARLKGQSVSVWVKQKIDFQVN
ncbi:MAG: energy transducer TonB [Bdellovibrionales bacterium]|nr:energy transducer TonB [Bdellovibrionales bacterium]